MSYFPTTSVTLANGPNIDAFARLRVSNPETLFDSQNQYSAATLRYEVSSSLNGSGSFLPNESSFQLSVPGTSGSSVIRQSRGYFRYQPGKSHLVILTGVMGALTPGVRQRIGYFDFNNGVFFEQDGNNLKVAQRSYTSGTPVDTYVSQSLWNLDKLNGSGSSGILLDTTKANIYFTDLEWLGVGRVRMGVFSNTGQPVYCHEFRNANSLTTPYMTTANLPVRFEITNTAATGVTSSMKHVCTAVISEGGTSEIGPYLGSVTSSLAGVAVTTRRALISIRPKQTLNGVTVRSIIIPTDYAVSAITNSSIIEFVYSASFSGTPVWVSAGPDSTVEYCLHADGAAGAFSGGYSFSTGMVLGATGTAGRYTTSDLVENRFPIVLDMNGNNPIPLSLVATSFTGTSTIVSTLNWKEIY